MDTNLHSLSKTDKTIQKSLERNYFKTTFKDIKNHPLLRNLKITDDEIIENRMEIKEALNSFKKCGDSKILCCNLSTHYEIKRNADQKLILTLLSCTKKIDYRSLDSRTVDQHIRRYLHPSSFIFFDHEEALNAIDKISDSSNGKFSEMIDRIGDPTYTINNKYIINDLRRELSISIAYHCILTRGPVCILKSHEIKNLFIRGSFWGGLFHRDEEAELKHRLIREIQNLIIMDLGMESEINAKVDYLLDIFPDVLSFRNKRGKSTHIITPITLEDVYVGVNAKKETKVSKKKLEELKTILKLSFSTPTKTLT